MSITFASPSTNPFESVSNVSSSDDVWASNNLNIEVYSDSVYNLANVVKILSITLSALALALFGMGYYTGKLIGI